MYYDQAMKVANSDKFSEGVIKEIATHFE